MPPRHKRVARCAGFPWPGRIPQTSVAFARPTGRPCFSSCRARCPVVLQIAILSVYRIGGSLKFDLSATLPQPAGDQPHTIEALTQGVRAGRRHQLLHGVTGSGKTYVMGKLISEVQLPMLVVSPSKLLAGQLYRTFREMFPHNAVNFFVSDYIKFVPEAYHDRSDRYTEKWAVLDPELTRQRMATLVALMTRRDVIVVATVSAMFGVGSPEDHRAALIAVAVGEPIDNATLIARLRANHYKQVDRLPVPGDFRVGPGWIDVFPVHEMSVCRIQIRNNVVVQFRKLDPAGHEADEYPGPLHIPYVDTFLISDAQIVQGIKAMRREMQHQVQRLQSLHQPLAAQRIRECVLHDIQRLDATGTCPGMENYLPLLSRNPRGTPPNTLLDFFPDDCLVFLDESHIMVPQMRGMHAGDRRRKEPLVANGFRLPSALDYRPLRFDEFEQRVGQCIYVSATPRSYERERAGDAVAEMIRRPKPTWLDPEIEIEPKVNQLEHLAGEIRQRVAVNDGVIVNTTTKRDAERVAAELKKRDIRAAWMHDGLDTKARVKLLGNFRDGKLDVLVGVNMLREGIDVPRVSLVAILDADKGGMLRDETSLLQFIGRAARNPRGKAILYANTVTWPMARVIQETGRRRRIQQDASAMHEQPPANRSA